MAETPDASSQDKTEQGLTEKSPGKVVATEQAQRAFTVKSLLFGLFILFFTILVSGYNDWVLRQSPFVGNQFPPGPYFLILCIALIWNPVVKRIYAPLRLNHKELAVALFIVFAGCWTGVSGLNQYFPHSIINSWNIYENNASWKNNKTMEYLPGHLFPLGGKVQAENAADIQGKPIPLELQDPNGQTDYQFNAKDLVYKNYTTSIPEGANVPYDAWLGPLSHWIPLIIVFAICILSMSLIVHRQWSHHEQLSYPLAQIGSAFIDTSDGRSLPALFYNRSFWIAAGGVFFFHLIRFLHAWFPSSVPDITTVAWFGFYYEVFPTLVKSNTFGLLHFAWSFSIIGITFFLSREIGLTLGLSQIMLAIIGAQFYISTGSALSGGHITDSRSGAYLAYAAVILYTGRYYYWAILKKAVNFRTAETHEEDGIFAMRLFLIAYIAFVTLLCVSCELDLFISIFYSLLILLLFLVFTRIICEAGVPFMWAGWQPSVLIINIFGVSAIGAAPIVMIHYLGLMFAADPRECMMPFVSNGLKIAEKHKVNLKTITKIAVVVVICAIVFSIFMKMTEHYNIGTNQSKNMPGQRWRIYGAMGSATNNLVELKDIGQLDKPASLLNMKPNTESGAISYLFIGAVCVFIFFGLRFRYAKFPLHPILFLVWGTHPMQRTFYIFLIGWFIRELVVRFGGGQIYQRCKPFFIGLIVGELFAAMLGIGFGFAYHLSTVPDDEPFWNGAKPKEFKVFGT